MRNLDPKKKKILWIVLAVLVLFGIANNNEKDKVKEPNAEVAKIATIDSKTDVNDKKDNNESQEALTDDEDKEEDETSKDSSNEEEKKEVVPTVTEQSPEEVKDNKNEKQKETIESKIEEQPKEESLNNNWTVAEVIKVVDGDTIDVNIGGEKHRVRFVLADTPETKHPRKPVEYYGKEASEFTKNQLEGKTVYLEQDVSDTDRYNRLLRYIWLEVPDGDDIEKDLMEKCFNAQLLLQGYANLATFPPDVKYVDYFKNFEAYARDNKIGLWGKEEEIATQEPVVINNGANEDSNNNESKEVEVIETQEAGTQENKGITCYIYKTGKKYHLDPSCSNKGNAPSKTTIEDAVSKGYGPCKKCAQGN